MKKKRILSMLLATALTMSCLPISASAEGTSQTDSANTNLLSALSWNQQNGGEISKKPAETDSYIHVSNFVSNNTSVISYNSSTVNTGIRSMPAGAYKLTVKLRSAPALFSETDSTLATANMDLDFHLNVKYKNIATGTYNISNWGQLKASMAGYANGAFYWPDAIDTNDDSTKIDIFVRNDSHFKYNYGSNIRLTTEWREYTMFFTAAAEAYEFQLDIRPVLGSENIVPFDIKDLSVVRIESFDDSAVDGIATSYVEIADTPELTGATGSAWIAQNGASVDTAYISGEEYNHTNIPTSGTDTVITAEKNVTLTPGKYALSGNFKLAMFDTAGDNAAELNINLKNGTQTLTSFNVALTDKWNKKNFEFEIDESLSFDTVELKVADKLVSLDYTDISLVEVIPPPDEEVSVENVTGENIDHISVANLTSGTTAVRYESGDLAVNKTLLAGSYKLSVKMRTANAAFNLNAANESEKHMDIRLQGSFKIKSTGGWQTIELSNWGLLKAPVAASGSNANYGNGAFYWPDTIDVDNKIDIFVRNSEQFKYTYGSNIRLTPEWRDYVIFFDIANECNRFLFDFIPGSGSEDIVPFDIADLSLVKVESFDDSATDGIAVSYTNASNTDHIKNGQWEAKNNALVDTNPKPTDFYHSDAPATGVNTIIKYNKSLDLVPGKYSIKAKYRIGEFDFDSDNTASLEIALNSANGTLLSSTTEISSVWSEFATELIVKADTAVTDIQLKASNKLISLDFTDLDIELLAPYVIIDGWAGNGGEFEKVTETTVETGTDYYINVSNLTSGGVGATYRDTSTAFVPGVMYKFSVWMRTVKHSEIPENMGGVIEDGKMNLQITIPKIIDENSGNLDISNSAMLETWANGEVLTNNFHTTSPGQKSALLTEEWQEYSVVFIPEKECTIDISFRRFAVGGEDIIPFDIDGLSIVQVEPDGNGGYTEISGNFIKNDKKHWASFGSSYVSVINKSDASEYSVAKAPADDNTEIYCTNDEILTPGTYEITGSFRLTNFDLGEIVFTDETKSEISSFGRNGNVKLSLYTGTNEIRTLSGARFRVSNTWDDITFILDTTVDIPMNSLKFVLDGNFDLAFKNISIAQTERLINISDVNGGIIMTLLMLKHDQEYNFKQMTKIDPVLDESSGKIGAESGADFNEYIHVSNLNNPQSGVRYRDTSTTFVPGSTYIFSVWLRSSAMSNDKSTDGDVVNDGKMNLNVTIPQVITENAGNLDVSNSAMLETWANGKPLAGTFYTGGDVQKSMVLDTEWVQYKAIFTAEIAGEISVSFRRFPKGGEDVIPFDIDGLSLVEVLENGEYGPELIKNEKTLWSELLEAKLSTDTESEFYRSVGGLRLDKNMLGMDKDTVAPGRYAISADFRLAKFDFGNITFTEDNATVTLNNNSLTIRAKLYEDKLSTDKNRDSFGISNDWKRGTFILNVAEETPINEVRFFTGTKLDIDFRNLEIKYLGEPIVKDPNEPEIVRPEPLPAIREGNLIDGAMNSSNLPYWFRGDQKLVSKKASDGTVYLSASEIENNSLGFTYEPGYTIMPGTYRFIGEFRTTNKGDKSIARAIVGGVSASTLIDNDWSKIDVVFSITEETELSLKIRGGPVSGNIQDYEMRNLQIIDANTITATSPFEDSNTRDYIHVSGLEAPGAGIVYRDNNITFNPGSTYKFTVWMRSMPMVNADATTGDVVNDGKMNISINIPTVIEENAGNLDISNEAMLKTWANGKIITGDFYTEGAEQKSAVLSDEWKPYSVIFTAEQAGYLSIAFKRFAKGGEDVVPFDIAGLSLVEIKENGTFGANLIKPSQEYWTEANGGKIAFETETGCENANGSITLSNSIVGKSSIPAGKYTVSANIRLSNVDVSKFTFAEDGITATENGNRASCTATLKDEELTGLKGESEFEVTNEWNNIWFTFETSKTVSVSDLIISLDSDLDFDIRNVKIEKNAR